MERREGRRSKSREEGMGNEVQGMEEEMVGGREEERRRRKERRKNGFQLITR